MGLGVSQSFKDQVKYDLKQSFYYYIKSEFGIEYSWIKDVEFPTNSWVDVYVDREHYSRVEVLHGKRWRNKSIWVHLPKD